MNLLNLAGLTVFSLAVVFTWLRIERRRRWVALILVVLPYLVAVGWWARARGQVGEALVGMAIAVAAGIAWWQRVGRHLPPPTSDNIKVWGQDT